MIHMRQHELTTRHVFPTWEWGAPLGRTSSVTSFGIPVQCKTSNIIKWDNDVKTILNQHAGHCPYWNRMWISICSQQTYHVTSGGGGGCWWLAWILFPFPPLCYSLCSSGHRCWPDMGCMCLHTPGNGTRGCHWGQLSLFCMFGCLLRTSAELKN